MQDSPGPSPLVGRVGVRGLNPSLGREFAVGQRKVDPA